MLAPTTRSLFLAAAMSLSGSTVGVSQQPQVENLEAVDTFFEPFSRLGGIRWLGEGDMLVSDRVEKSVYRINFETGDYGMVGRNGQGPQEYDSPIAILPFADRTSAVIDMGNMRMALMKADGAIDETFPLMQDMTFRMPNSADELGNVYYSSQGTVSVSRGSGPPPTTTPSEAAITRWNPLSGTTEDVGRIAIPPRDLPTGGITISGGQVSGMPAPRPFRPQDAWAVARDGRIAIARAEPYHVEWIAPDGSETVGPTITYQPVRIRSQDKEAWADAQSQQTGSMMISGGSGGGSRSFQFPRPDVDEVEFPDAFPAFNPQAATVSYDGDFWIQRYQSYSSDRVLFDVFDGQGNLIRRVALPEGRTVLGFGPGSLYAYYQDQDDLQWLERYDLDGR